MTKYGRMTSGIPKTRPGLEKMKTKDFIGTGAVFYEMG